MAKREWIPDDLEKEMTAFIISQPAKLKREKVLENLTTYLTKHRPGWRIPADATLLNEISKTRNKPDPEGAPWCLGAKLDIPNEALPAVLQAWKESKLDGSLFTIREARWCATLSAFIKDSWTLRSWAWGYANREWACKLLELDFDTSDFDTILTTPPWELVTGYLTGGIKPVVHGIFRFDKIGRRVVPSDKPSADSSGKFQYPVTPFSFTPVIIGLDVDALCAAAATAEWAFLWGVEERVATDQVAASYSYDERDIDTVQKQLGIDSRYAETPVVGQLGFSQEQVRVYTLWLQYFAKGPYIKRLIGETDFKKISRQLNKRLKIVHELREWVKNHKLAKEDSSCLLPFAVDPDFLDSLDTQYKLKPVELLKKVGYKA